VLGISENVVASMLALESPSDPPEHALRLVLDVPELGDGDQDGDSLKTSPALANLRELISHIFPRFLLIDRCGASTQDEFDVDAE
jgi:hypothetical protein